MTLRQRMKYWLYGSCPGFAGAFPYFGSTIYFRPGSWSFRAACEQGIFEEENVRLLQGLARPASWMFDVGANIGLTSVPVLQAVTGVSVLAFEPSPNVVQHLERTVAESPYRDRWQLVSKAAGANVGPVQFSIANPEQSLFDGLKPTKRVPAASRVTVEMTTMDAEWTRLGKPPVSVVKIDVEGAETEVLNGGAECLAATRPHIMLEWNLTNLSAYGVSPDALLTFSEARKFRVFALPYLVNVQEPRELRLHMLKTETFLLCP